MAVDNKIRDKVEIVSAVINTRGKQVDLKPHLVTVSIFENVYSPFVFCQLQLLDHAEMARRIPLIGEEYFTIEFKTPNRKTVNYTFLLYKQDSVSTNDMNNATTFVLRGVTDERALDSALVVSSSYTGTVSTIVDRLYETYFQNRALGAQLFVERTKGITKFLFPSCTPLESVEMMRRKAVSATNSPSPYLFFRNSDGYHFRSMNGIFAEHGQKDKAKIVHTFGATLSNPTETDEFVVGGIRFKNDIVSFTLEKKYDTIDKVEEGVFSNYSASFDLTTKMYSARSSFNLSEKGNGFTLGTMGEINTPKFINDFKDTQCKTFFSVTDVALEIEGATRDWTPEYTGEMHAYKNMLQQHAQIRMIGNSDITAGDVLAIEVPRATSEKVATRDGRREDVTQSGLYLLAAVRHDIVIDSTSTYSISATGLKGSYIGTIEEMSSDEE